MDNETGFDLLLQNGHVIDPAQGIDEQADVAIADGRIAAIGQALPEHKAHAHVDCQGLYVVPGLIDMHVHVYPHRVPFGVVADAHSFSAGITTMIDAGSAGAVTFGLFKEQVLDRARTRVLAFVNIVDLGMGGDFEQDPRRMDPLAAAHIAQAFPEQVVGIKAAHYWVWQPWDAEHPPWLCVDRAVEAGSLCGKPVMVDFWPRPPQRPYEDLILKHLRPGDIHTHVYARQFPLMLPEGRLNPALEQARKRGVIFDVGHGAGSFWFRQAQPAIQQGFVADSISTDLHTGNAATGLVGDLLQVMSKFLNMGLSLSDVIARATVAPAKEIGHPELGTLALGSCADVAVLTLERGGFAYIDCGHARMPGDRRLRCLLTLRAGEIVYDPQGLSMPDWPKAPPRYWRVGRPPGAPENWEGSDPF